MAIHDETALAPLYSELFRRLPHAIIVCRAEQRGLVFVTGNDAASEFTSADFTDAEGKLLTEIFPQVEAERLALYMGVALNGTARKIGVIDYFGRRFDVDAIPLAGNLVAILFDNLTEPENVAHELKKVNRFLDSVIENIPAMIFWKEAKELRFERFNRLGEDLIGVKSEILIGKNDFDFFPPEEAEFFQSKDREVLQKKTLVDIPEEIIQTPRGKRWLHTKKIPLLDENGVPQYLLGISEDITERREFLRKSQEELEARVRQRTAALAEATENLERQLLERRRAEEALRRAEEQLRHSQKMEAIGRLAGGIAHDFNNLLSVVLGLTSLLLNGMGRDDPMRVDLEEIKTAGERAAALTQQLLAFSRQQVLEPRLVDLNEVIANMDRMLRRLLGEDIDLIARTYAGTWTVKVDPNQMEQVLMNLALNARDAMPNGGRLTLETANVDLDETYAREHLDVPAGEYVMVAVSDTGNGIEKETIAHIFEPFFTTKERGKGTGLGLSTAFGIVKQSGGSMWVYSEPGRGTTFKVYIPRARDLFQAPAVPQLLPTTLSGTETILLVEDEDAVRHVASTILRRNGYEVLEARNGAEALHRCRKHSGPVHLLLTDVVMPRMSGRKLAEQLHQIRPNLRVLYMSGYTENAIDHHGVLDVGVAFIQKPITPDALARKVREVLDASVEERAAAQREGE
jgi:PAS domain S-box-containing protein